jgi:hypothetical protein
MVNWNFLLMDKPVEIIHGPHKGGKGHCTYADDSGYVRVTPYNGDPLASISLQWWQIQPVDSEDNK